MGSSKKQTVWYRYYMGLHFGLCHGPVDEVQRIKVGDREAWYGSVNSNTSVSINAPKLFGGDKKEGGIVGQLDIALGGVSQTANSYLTSKIGTPMPAFRGIVSAIWRQGQVSANNPYVKPWAFRLKRILEGWSGGAAWYPDKASLHLGDEVIPDSYHTILAHTESFESASGWPSNSYFVISGGAISNSTTTAPWDGTQIEKNITPITDVNRIEIDFSITSSGSGDTMGVNFIQGITFVGRSETLVDSQQRPRFNESVLDIQPLDIGTGYGLVFEKSAQQWTVKIVQTATQATIYSGVASGIPSDLTVSRISFYRDADPSPSVMAVSDVRIFSDVPRICSNWAMNPAHIIYQCLTDGVWGMGYPTSALDDASFTAAADTLYSEAFGMSLIWNRQDTIESFIGVVLDHIGGILYVDPSTGKFALKLIRDDYVKNTLPIYGPSNLIGASDYQRQALGETVNEITVVYTDSCSNKDTSVTVQDLANIQTQGAVVAQVKQYPGITNTTLAQRVAMRDLIAVSTPLAKIKLTANRQAWDVIPGDVIRLTWPEYGIEDVVYRVLEVNRGTLQAGEITIDAVEDVFGMPSNTYAGTQAGGWVDPASAPIQISSRKLIEAPYWDIARTLSAADLAYLDSLSGYLQTVAASPTGDSMNYEINAKVGAADYAERGQAEFCPTATLTSGLTVTTTSIAFSGMVDVDSVVTGGYAMIGDECVGVTAIDAVAGTATITRGLLDTVPAAHASGARIWFVDGFQGEDETEYASGETVDVKLLPRTGLGELEIADAAADSLTMNRRHNRPYPPGKLRVNTLAYPEWIDGQAAFAVAWAHRDRLQQTAYLVQQDENSIGPEAGTTYNLRIYGETDTLIRTYSGLSGTSQTYPTIDELNDSQIIGSGSIKAYNEEVLDDAPVAYYRLGESSGTTMTDSSGNGRNGTYPVSAGVTLGASGLLGSGSNTAVSLNSSSGGTRLDCGFATDYTSACTLEAIINVDVSQPKAFPLIIGKVEYYASAVGRFPVALVYDAATDKLNLRLSKGDDYLLDLDLRSNAGIGGGTHHIAAVYRANGQCEIWVDGVMQASSTINFTVSTTTQNWVIGAAHEAGGGVGNTGLKGVVDEVAIYNKALSSSRIQAHANASVLSGIYRINGRLRLELESSRGGLISYQKHNYTVLREGWGFNYGHYWGGQP